MSNLIKAEFAKSESDKKIIKHRTLSFIHSIDKNDTQDLTEIYEMADKILSDAQCSAEAILADAKQEYENVLLKINGQKKLWEEEKKQLIEESRKSGYQAGFQTGKEESIHEYTQQIRLAREVTAQSKEEANKYIEASERTILQLSLKIAEQILAMQLDENEAAFLNLVKKALKETKEHYHINLYIHPTRYGFLLSHKDELLVINNREKNLLIYPDDDLDINSCILESSFGRIDASVDSQLSELKEKLQSLLEEA